MGDDIMSETTCILLLVIGLGFTILTIIMDGPTYPKLDLLVDHGAVLNKVREYRMFDELVNELGNALKRYIAANGITKELRMTFHGPYLSQMLKESIEEYGDYNRNKWWRRV